MNKKELKGIIKPLIKECLTEILVEVEESSGNATLVAENSLNNVSDVTNATGV